MTAVSNPAKVWLRLEGLAVLAASILAYYDVEASWLWFAILFFAPDLSMLAYLAGARAGALAYNLFHSYVGPIGLGIVGIAAENPLLLSLALIWSAHIGLDRLLGYGLKYPTGFQHTHLGVIGRRKPAENN